MKTVDLIKLYWKQNHKWVVIGTILFALYCYFLGGKDTLFLIPLWLVNWVRAIYQYGERLKRIEKLKGKGLTEQDITNIKFVKKWQETRSGGLWKYCIRDGGIVAGAGFSLALSLLFGITFRHTFRQILAEPGDMFSFIGYAYLCGSFVGLILFRIMWSYNEKRFARLTDPLNTIFASKKLSFDDII